MKIRATLKVRNAKMIEAREAVGLTQLHVANACDIPVGHVSQMEMMNFSSEAVRDNVPTVAGFLGVESQDIMPPELDRVDARMDAVRTCDIEPGRLLEMAYNRTAMLTADVDLDNRADAKLIVNNLMESLTIREKSIIQDRFYDGLTLSEVGVRQGVSRERVRSLEARAIRKMRDQSEAQQSK